LPDSVGICTFIIIRMLALLMFEATDRREAETRSAEGAAKATRRRDGTRTASERHEAPAQANLRPPRNTRQADQHRPKLVRRLTDLLPSPMHLSGAASEPLRTPNIDKVVSRFW
jgi:hypothetical protein